jgi:hypothetical protein
MACRLRARPSHCQEGNPHSTGASRVTVTLVRIIKGFKMKDNLTAKNNEYEKGRDAVNEDEIGKSR